MHKVEPWKPSFQEEDQDVYDDEMYQQPIVGRGRQPIVRVIMF